MHLLNYNRHKTYLYLYFNSHYLKSICNTSRDPTYFSLEFSQLVCFPMRSNLNHQLSEKKYGFCGESLELLKTFKSNANLKTLLACNNKSKLPGNSLPGV